MTPIIRTENLSRTFKMGDAEVHAVDQVSLEVLPGKMTAVVGRSGSGKTTFLNLISGLDQPTSGNIWFEDDHLSAMSVDERLILRRDHIGFVFQSFGLLPLLTAAENVGVPLRMRRLPHAEREARIQEALEWVNLADRMEHRPYELSGGEQQRVAIARALACRPKIVLADEPTGQLDSFTGQSIIDLLRRLVEEQGITALIVTHDPKVMQAVDIVHEFRDGRLIETRYPSPDGQRPVKVAV